MSSGLGKGLKTSAELFKRTEAPLQAEAAAQATGNEDRELPVRKHFILPAPLAERLRRFCFEQREKEASAVRSALAQFLAQRGY